MRGHYLEETRQCFLGKGKWKNYIPHELMKEYVLKSTLSSKSDNENDEWTGRTLQPRNFYYRKRYIYRGKEMPAMITDYCSTLINDNKNSLYKRRTVQPVRRLYLQNIFKSEEKKIAQPRTIQSCSSYFFFRSNSKKINPRES